jgi:hypothetical protein
MTNTTPKRGRPSTKTAASKPTAVSTKKQQIKRSEKVNETLEYKTLRKKGAVHLMTQSGVSVHDKTTDTVRQIRYCPSESSIFTDEQSDFARKEAIVFNDGRLFVRPDQPNLRDYMNTHPGNAANGGTLFKLENKEKKAELKVDQEFLVADAVSLVRDKDLNDLLGVAVALGIGVDRPVNEVKHDLLVYAKKNPSNFISSFDNPVVEMKAKVRQAAKYQIIKLDRDGVKWYDSNQLIVSVPSGKDPTDVFVRYCLTEAAVPVVEQIEKQLG